MSYISKDFKLHVCSEAKEIYDVSGAGDTVIAMLNNLPEEFELKQFIDNEKQFSKAFLDPMIGILNIIGWEHERKTNIMGFFT